MSDIPTEFVHVPGQMSLDDVAPEPHTLARAGQPDTAFAAAVEAATGKRSAAIRERVRTLLQAHPGGLTDDELAERCADLTSIRHSVATRRGEWMRLGHVVDSGARRPSATGRSAVVWRWCAVPQCPAGWDEPAGDDGGLGDALARLEQRLAAHGTGRSKSDARAILVAVDDLVAVVDGLRTAVGES